MDLRASFAVNGRSGGLIQFHTGSSLLVGGWKVKTFVGMVVCAVLFVSLGADAFAAHSNYGCVNCHVAHKADLESIADGQWGVPLWSPYQTDTPALTGWTLYDTYGIGDTPTPTLDASLQQPNGPSKLCLGCHDGSYSHDWTGAENRIFTPGTVTGHMSLKNSHPISFYYPSVASADTEIKAETQDALMGNGKTIEQELLDTRKYMQCTSCHDVHASGYTDFMLRWDIGVVEEVVGTDPATGDDILEPLHIASYGSQVMCRTCHDK